MSSAALQLLRDMLTRRQAAIENATIDEVRRLTEHATPLDGTVFSVDRMDAGGVPAELVTTPGANPLKRILYFHGGGYVFGSISGRRDIASRISQAAGSSVLLIGYRLAPEHPFPAALEDATAAYRWLLKQGIEPKHITVAGDSAGAGLALALLVALRDSADPLPVACVCISPWADLTCSGRSMQENAGVDPLVRRHKLVEWAEYYLNGEDPKNPLASPLYATLARLPPLLIQVGTAEVLLDDATRLADRAREAGNDVTIQIWVDMVHNWPIFAAMLPEDRELPERRQAIDSIGEFLLSHDLQK